MLLLLSQFNIIKLYISLVIVLTCIIECRKKNNYKLNVAEDVISTAIPNQDKKNLLRTSKTDKFTAIPDYDKYSIEDVDEEKINEILRDGTKNLVVFFYDGRLRCPECSNALSEIEKIDDDIEGTGYIEVVKTDDRRVVRECGVSTFPSLVYFRRNNPILYDGEFENSENIWRWLRAHDEVSTWDLNDDNFESRTNSYLPDEGNLDWFVMFYDSEKHDCNSFIGTWENIAHKLRGLIHVGKIDVSVSDDVSERFRIDDNQCPTFHRGKMYRYNDPAKDIRGLTNFALYKFKEQRGHRVPEPPTALEHFYEHVKEKISYILDDNQTLTAICVTGSLIIVSIAIFIKAYRIKSQQIIEKKSN